MTSSNDPTTLDVVDLAARLADRSLSSVELTEACLSRIARYNDALHAFIDVYAEDARNAAKAADLARGAGHAVGPLHGIPFGLKDLVDLKGKVTTGGSKAWRDRISETTGTLAERLIAAGMIVIGKTHTVEFAFGAWGTNQHMGTPRNPWDMRTHRTPGGSSSGSGVAVSSRMVPWAIGTDTGGSVRVPAACTGIVGLRPTLGRVPIKGVFPRAESFDVVGPFARNVRDCALVMGSLTGENFAGEIEEGVAGLRVGLLEDYCDLARILQSLGAEVSAIKVPLEYAHLVEVMLYEFNRTLGEHFRACPNPDEMFGPVVCANLRRGPKITEADYARALGERKRQSAAIRAVFGEIDALVTPVLPAPTPRLDAPAEEFDQQRKFMIPFSGAGVPAISLPCGMSEGLPVGLQIVADRGRETLLFRIAQAYESTTGWHTMPWRKTPGGGAS